MDLCVKRKKITKKGYLRNQKADENVQNFMECSFFSSGGLPDDGYVSLF